MSVTVRGQRPVDLDPLPKNIPSMKGPADPFDLLRQVVVDPLFTPLGPGHRVSFDDAGVPLSPDDVRDRIALCLGASLDVQTEAWVKQVLGQTLMHYDPATTLPVNELFAAQAGNMLDLPDPSPVCLYHAGNAVIPAAKELLTGAGPAHQFFAGLAYAFHPETLGVWFRTERDFDDLTAQLRSQLPLLQPVLPNDSFNLLSQFARTRLSDLVEAFVLRHDDADGQGEFAFPRVLTELVMSCIAQQRSAHTDPPVGLLPFVLDELVNPTSIVLVNVEAHARATPAEVTREWNLVRQGLAGPIRVVSRSQLRSATLMPRLQQRNTRGHTNEDEIKRAAGVTFRRRPPSTFDLSRDVRRILERMAQVNHSQNALRTVHTSFQRANRRHPNDPNRPGRSVRTRYRPDIHVYVDTSGSMTEENYEDAVRTLIVMAKRLDVNLWFNSFADYLSSEKLLHVKGHSVRQIWREFAREPKVGGGTRFDQVWEYVNQSKRRSRQFSLIISDMDWVVPKNRREHPRHLYYTPCATGQDYWPQIVRNTRDFMASMSKHIEPNIGRRMLGLFE